MKTRATTILVLTLAVLPAYAQETSAQRARAFAALPNWTGYWESEAAAALFSGPPAGAHTGPKPASSAPPPADGASPEEAFAAAFLKLAGKPPYNAQWKKKSLSVRRDHFTQGVTKTCGDDYASFPAMMEDVFPDNLFQLLVTPEETLLLTQFVGGVRHIFTDGRPHPKKEDLWPTAIGDSIGHWEGATLVIDTIARKPGPISPLAIANLSEQAHFTERLTLTSSNTLQNDMTIDDPQRFVHPWKISLRYQRVTDQDRMIPVNCEHDRNPVVNGKETIAPN